MKDYSQTGEQAAILEALGYDGEPTSCRGRFLDIGAWNPVALSNTRALWELGWSGVFIEPSPGPLRNLVKEYGNYPDRAMVIGGAVTVEGNLISLEVTDDAVSAPHGSLEHATWREKGGYYGTLHAPSICLAYLFARLGGDFDMVSIDTEGTSVDLFAEMIRIGPRPRCVVVEHNDRIVELNQFAQAAAYRQVLLNGNNAVFQWTSGL